MWVREKKRETKQTISVQKMTPEDLKIGIFNFAAFVISFTNLEATLKIFLLIVTILYTLQKIIHNYEDK